MKILHVVSSLNVGGAERFVIDLAVEQKMQLAHDVEVLSMGKLGEPLESELTKHGIKVHLVTSILSLRTIISPFDVAHIHSSYCLLRVLLSSITNRNTKLIYTRHNEKVHVTLKWHFVYALARFKLHKMLFVSEKARTAYLGTYSEFSSKSHVILNGVLPVTVKKYVADKIKLGHIGRFVPLKAQHTLIEATSLLPVYVQNKIALNFFGTGDLLEFNRKLASIKIPNIAVTFFGFESDRNEIFSNIDILVVTSETEGLSLAILEALASGTPIIATNVGGNPEIVHSHKNGFLFPFDDPQSLAQAIETLILDDDLRSLFSSYSKNLYHSKFSMRRCAVEYLQSYQ